MLAVLTPAEMAEVDANAAEPLETLIARAGWMVAREARRMLGGTYGRRVHVVAGKGNNGEDGRVAAGLLARSGVRVTVSGPGSDVPRCDLVIDAAFGTGLTRAYQPGALPSPRPLVLAVDCPSGLDGLTGNVAGDVWRADRTITFGSYKPGLLLGEGPRCCGHVVVESLGLDVEHAVCRLVDAASARSSLRDEPDDLHKWRRAAVLFAGSPGMDGAAELSGSAALRSGVRFLRVVSEANTRAPLEAVHVAGAPVLPADIDRFAAVAVGPGLGSGPSRAADVAAIVSGTPTPVVVDADGLNALAGQAAAVCRQRVIPAILTPHDGEFERLSGSEVGVDRLAAAARLAREATAVVLLKGRTTVVAAPDGATRMVAHGDQRLATAGSGDVLTGMILGLLTRGFPPLDAAAFGAALHASLLDELPGDGVVASDLVGQIPRTLSVP